MAERLQSMSENTIAIRILVRLISELNPWDKDFERRAKALGQCLADPRITVPIDKDLVEWAKSLKVFRVDCDTEQRSEAQWGMVL